MIISVFWAYYKASRILLLFEVCLPFEPSKHSKALSQPYYVAAGINSSLLSRPSALFPAISNIQQLFCSVGKACDGNQSRKYNTDVPLVNSELEHGEDAITASGNGDSEVEKQTAKSAVGIY